MLNQINQKDLTFTVEKVNIPGQPFRSLVQYQNINNLYLRIVQSEENPEPEQEYYYSDKSWEKIIRKSPLRSWQQLLPDTKDFQQHSVELKVDGLPAGRYILLASAEKDFSLKNNIVGARFFYVSNISFVNNGRNYFVLNRETGQPLAGGGYSVLAEKIRLQKIRICVRKGKFI